jgi:hypothetical protein
MAKDVEIVEGGAIMDPMGSEFQEMLQSAQSAAGAKVPTEEVPPVSVGETGVDTVSPTTPPEENLEEDPESLKAKLAGLQAELTRVRKQKTGNEGEASTLRETIADMQGQLKVLREGKTEKTLQDKVGELTYDQVQDNAISWTDELADARAVSRQAERDQDQEGLRTASQRIDAARKMLKLYDTEKQVRAVRLSESTKTEGEQKSILSTEMNTLFSSTQEAIPELNDKTSDVWKAGQAEYRAYPALMARLGPLGELLAVASAIAKNPSLVGKKAAAKLLANLEDVTDKAFQKGGTAPQLTSSRPVSITSQKDLSDFEAQVQAVKMG